jgi:hypothetical protein
MPRPAAHGSGRRTLAAVHVQGQADDQGPTRRSPQSAASRTMSAAMPSRSRVWSGRTSQPPGIAAGEADPPPAQIEGEQRARRRQGGDEGADRRTARRVRRRAVDDRRARLAQGSSPPEKRTGPVGAAMLAAPIGSSEMTSSTPPCSRSAATSPSGSVMPVVVAGSRSASLTSVRLAPLPVQRRHHHQSPAAPPSSPPWAFP